ncbi:MAG: hypothetical protein CMF42_04545 [Legionellales bacterium]|nr:hypothetical protein [Legionellales bacterium]OUX67287.1 MAG: hypothetical protein CBD38_02735 [bacterium TMED178]|tara:strand:- start:48 stop:575 length:528 start_codon:yes stop_codon:yes gene_type:complete
MLYVVPFILLLSGCSVLQPYTGMSEEDWQNSNNQSKLSAISTYTRTFFEPFFQSKPQPGSESLLVRFKSGYAKMWPSGKSMPVKPTMLYLSPNSCQTVQLQSQSSNEHTNLKFCLDGDTLNIDPSRWNAQMSHSSLNINRNIVWDEGMVYNGLNSKGYAQLQDANLYIQSIKSSD